METTVTKWALAALAAAALSGCRAEEQGRPLSYTPGVYQGVVDETLSAEQQERLRARVDRQSF